MDSNYVDFNPDIMAGQILRGILNELVKCQGFFDDWAEQLVMCVVNQQVSDETLTCDLTQLRQSGQV